MAEIRRHQDSVDGERVRRDRSVEVLDPSTAPFQRRLDASVGLTDIVGPLSAADL
jgi:hypothetical protein